jgi:hypothetical protein
MVQNKSGVSKDEADVGASWFETRKSAPHHEGLIIPFVNYSV